MTAASLCPLGNFLPSHVVFLIGPRSVQRKLLMRSAILQEEVFAFFDPTYYCIGQDSCCPNLFVWQTSSTCAWCTSWSASNRKRRSKARRTRWIVVSLEVAKATSVRASSSSTGYIFRYAPRDDDKLNHRDMRQVRCTDVIVLTAGTLLALKST